MASKIIGIAETKIKNPFPTFIQRMASRGTRRHIFLSLINDEGESFKEIHVLGRNAAGELPKSAFATAFANASDLSSLLGMQEAFKNTANVSGLSNYPLYLTAKFFSRVRSPEEFETFHPIDLVEKGCDDLETAWSSLEESVKGLTQSRILYDPMRKNAPINCRSGLFAILKRAGFTTDSREINWSVKPEGYHDVSDLIMSAK